MNRVTGLGRAWSGNTTGDRVAVASGASESAVGLGVVVAVQAGARVAVGEGFGVRVAVAIGFRVDVGGIGEGVDVEVGSIKDWLLHAKVTMSRIGRISFERLCKVEPPSLKWAKL